MRGRLKDLVTAQRTASLARALRERQMVEQLDKFAELLAEGRHINTAARKCGLRPVDGREMFRRICAGLGPQAR